MFRTISTKQTVDSIKVTKSYFLKNVPILILGSLLAIFVLDITDLKPLAQTKIYSQKLQGILGLRQNWEMFAPFVRKDQVWIVTEAKYKSGDIIDIFSDREPDYHIPFEHISSIKSGRWVFVYLSFLYGSNQDKTRLKSFLIEKAKEHRLNDPLENMRVFFLRTEYVKQGDSFLPTTSIIEVM